MAHRRIEDIRKQHSKTSTEIGQEGSGHSKVVPAEHISHTYRFSLDQQHYRMQITNNHKTQINFVCSKNSRHKSTANSSKIARWVYFAMPGKPSHVVMSVPSAFKMLLPNIERFCYEDYVYRNAMESTGAPPEQSSMKHNKQFSSGASTPKSRSDGDRRAGIADCDSGKRSVIPKEGEYNKYKVCEDEILNTGEPATATNLWNSAKISSQMKEVDYGMRASAAKQGSNSEHDVEKAPAREYVTIRIAGMTCTGCVRKISGILASIDGVSGININFVAASGEFYLDPNGASADDVIRQVASKTGFKCSRLQPELQTLDLVMPPNEAFELIKSILPGVHSVRQVKKVYETVFDPAKIGARSLFERTGAEGLGPPRNSSDLAAGKKQLMRLCASFVVSLIFTVPVVVLEWTNSPLPYTTRSWIVITFATIVQGVAIPEFYVGAIRSLLYSRIIEMDMLVVISITAAYLYSVVAFSLAHTGHKLEQGEFFETSTLLVTLVLLGRIVSAYAKHRAVTAVSFKSIQADKALLVIASGSTREIDARLLQYGDILHIPPHTKIVTDGIVVDGNGSINESMLTGESVPVPKTVGDLVIAGTINEDTTLTIRLTRLPGKNSITDIANLVEQALATKPGVQDLADTMASYFIPLVMTIAVMVFSIWIIVCLKVRNIEAGGSVGVAITYAIAVLAISCPCALGLAVPMVLVIAGGLAARNGIIIKKADATERSHKVTDVVFDKTGTLTYGDLQVQQAEILATEPTELDVSSLVLGLVKDNDHPVSKAISKFEASKDISPASICSVKSIPGKGLEATWNGHKVRAGNPYWLGLSTDTHVLSMARQGLTLFCVMVDQSLVGIYGLRAAIRSEATSVISELSKRNIVAHIVSGDGHEAVSTIAACVEVPPANVMACQSPSEKQAYVKKLMDQGRYVLFCGDGTNDAVAVAQAHVGVQIGDTSDMTKAMADVVLLGGLEGILDLLDISRRAYRRIVFNFVWSFIYNFFAIMLASGAFIRVRIPPAYAGLGEIVSVLPIVLVALSLMRKG